LVVRWSLIRFGLESPTHALNGAGLEIVVLVNVSRAYRLAVRRVTVVRFYLTNVSNTRTLNLSFPGARMKLVARMPAHSSARLGRERRDRTRRALCGDIRLSGPAATALC